MLTKMTMRTDGGHALSRHSLVALFLTMDTPPVASWNLWPKGLEQVRAIPIIVRTFPSWKQIGVALDAFVAKNQTKRNHEIKSKQGR